MFLCLLPVPTGNSFALGLTRVRSYDWNVVPRTSPLTEHTLAGLGVFFSTFGEEKGGSRNFPGAKWQLWALSLGKNRWPVIPGAGDSGRKAAGAA